MPKTLSNMTMEHITWDDFSKVELRVGRVLSAEPLPKARNPAFVLQIDFGPEIGIKKSSAQITQHYSPEELVGKLVLAVTNFPPKQVGSIMSECLVTGFHDANGAVRLCVPDGGLDSEPSCEIPLGTRLA